MQDSNLRMHESKSCALPTWLIPSIKLVSAQGFEPRTHALEGRCSIQLSYAPTILERETRFELATSTLARLRSTTELFPHLKIMVRMKGVEPSCPAWEAGVLPMNYTRILICIDDTILFSLFPVFEKSYLDLKSLVTSDKKVPLSRCFCVQRIIL